MDGHRPPAPRDAWLLPILGLAAALLFVRLDHRPFWQDEAETACLARSVLRHGLPFARDAGNVVSQEEGREYGPDHLWRWSPWGAIYVAAAGFLLGGENETAGRFPFALAGLATVWLVHRWIRDISGSAIWARFSALGLALSVPFLLHARQCRYYGLGMLLTAAVLWGTARRGRAGWSVAVAAGIALVHVNYLMAISLTCGLCAVWLLDGCPRPPKAWGLYAGLAGAAAGWVAGVVLYRIGGQGSMLDASALPANLVAAAAGFVQFLLPLPVLLVLAFRARRGGAPGEAQVRRMTVLALSGAAATALLAPQFYFRYLVHLLAPCSAVLGWCAWRLWEERRAAGLWFAALAFGTNWLHLVPLQATGLSRRPWHNDAAMLTHPNLPLALYGGELAGGYPDVNEAFIRHLRAHARPGDLVLATYGDLPLQFHTACRVLGGLQGTAPAGGEAPAWIIVRRRTFLTRGDELPPAVRWIESTDLGQQYQATALDVPDEPFGNQPDPYWHRFRPPSPPFAPATVHRRVPDRGPGSKGGGT